MTVNIEKILVDRPEGLWNRDACRRHFSDLGQRLTRSRRIHGKGRVLVDLSGTFVQPQEAFSYVQSDLAGILVPADRIAFAGGGALLRMQKKRLTLPAETEVFEKVEDARSWLEQG